MIPLIFLIVQIVLVLVLILHDWVSLPPLNDIEAQKKARTFPVRLLNTVSIVLFPAIALALTIYYYPHYSGEPLSYFTTMYPLYFFGEIFSWWLPYFFGWPKQTAAELRKEYTRTLTILPVRGTNPTPDVLHLIVHSLTLIAAVLARWL